MKKTLILKNENNSFEKFFSNIMRRENIDVQSPFLDVGKIVHYVRALCKKSRIHKIFGLWLNTWKNNLEEYETVIIFDNCLTLSLLKWLKKEKPSINLKIWLWNIPEYSLTEYKKLAEIYCFDIKFSNNYSLKYIDQFYFPIDLNQSSKLEYDILFVGANKNREQDLLNLSKIFKNFCCKILFKIKAKKTNEKINSNEIVYIENYISYEENLNLISKTRAILELNKSGQSGITLRALEALFYKKKLITNNIDICKYDFYNADNIFIIGKDSWKNFQMFMDKSYVDISQDIKEKYLYDNWVKSILQF